MTNNKKSILVIGATSSLGNEILSIFNTGQTQIVGTYCDSRASLSSENIKFLELDFTSQESIDSFAVNLQRIFHELDVIIFLSAILPGKALIDYELSEIDDVLTVNFSGYAKLMKIIDEMIVPTSRIIVLSSVSAQRGSYDPIYAASKGALLSFVKSMASRLPKGASINAVAPSLIADSNMYQTMSSERRAYHEGLTHSNKLLALNDLAKIIYDLSRDHWRHLNGACIDINGGTYVR